MQKLLLTIPLFYCGLCLLVYFYQKNLMFFPNQTDLKNCRSVSKLGGTAVTSADGLTRLYHIPALAENPKGWILHFHGNGGRACDRVEIVDKFLDLGYHLVLSEYPGYAETKALPDNDEILESAKKSYEFIESKNEKALPVILYGESLGTGPATYLASLNLTQVTSLILQTPFPSFGDVGQHHYFYLPVKLLLKNDFKAQKWAKDVKVPVFVFHGDEDEVIPYKLGKQQADNFSNVTFFEVKGSRHNDLFYSSGDLIWKEIEKFLARR